MEERFFLVAIVGPSASGKDSIAKELHKMLGDNSNLIISDTTRPQRSGEENGKDYFFLEPKEFEKKLDNNEYLETTVFRGWCYGTNKNSLKENVVNIGVFNPSGLFKIANSKNIRIFPVFCYAPLLTRIKRSKKREGKFKVEFLRRAWTDFCDFSGIVYYLKNSFLYNWKYIRTDKKSVHESAKTIKVIISSTYPSIMVKRR